MFWGAIDIHDGKKTWFYISNALDPEPKTSKTLSKCKEIIEA